MFAVIYGGKMKKTSNEFGNIKEYRLEYEEQLKDSNSQGLVYRHEKSGARVCVLVNEDENKVFSVGFRTPPANSTGVAHIVEHTVLCGSRKFPAKDPFIELSKGSLNTFLNAMTFPDKTMYPVASCNDKDFRNLEDVYMDAVFYPNIYKKEEIFQQEGWHYDLETPEDELTINGIVYSEMKGAFSNPEEQLYREIQENLFPDNCYGVESGGDPDFIPDLSYTEFLEFHSKYYHPSNSYIYLYGNIDVEEQLSWLDQEYLSDFSYQPVNSEIQIQRPTGGCSEHHSYYPLGEEESVEDGTFFNYSTTISTILDVELATAFEVLDRVLISNPGAPVKQALIDAGIGKDVLGGYSPHILQPYFSFTAKNAKLDRKNDFIEVIHSTLKKIIQEGINERSVLAALNSMEFRYREGEFGRYPKGLLTGMQVLTSWLYDDSSAFIYLKMNQVFKELKNKIGTGYFENLIQTYFLNSNHASYLVLEPKRGLNVEKETELRLKLAKLKDGMTEDEINHLAFNTRKLTEYQDEESTEEDLLKIPLLSRKDIQRDAPLFYNRKHTIDGVDVLQHPLETNRVGYIKLLFDCSSITENMVPYLSLLSSILGNIDTKDYSYLEFTNETDLYTGGIRIDLTSFSQKGDSNYFQPMLILNVKMLYENMGKAMDLIQEVIFTSKFGDHKRLLEILGEIQSKLQTSLNSNGDSAASNRALSYSSEGACFSEQTSGISYYQFISNLLEHFSEKKEEITDQLQNLIQLLIQKNNLLVSITVDEEGLSLFKPLFLKFLQKLNNEMIQEDRKPLKYTPVKRNEGFQISGQVQYVACAGNLMKAGYHAKGSLRVLKTILNLDYLWNTIRVKGGAYGAGFQYSGLDGYAYFYSYRDPNLTETMQVYKNAYSFVKNFEVSERDMTKYVIGTIGGIDRPMSPAMKGARSLAAYLTKQEYQDIQRERDEILNVTKEEIRSQADLIRSIVEENNWCVVGNENKLKANKEVFYEIKPLFK